MPLVRVPNGGSIPTITPIAQNTNDHATTITDDYDIVIAIGISQNGASVQYTGNGTILFNDSAGDGNASARIAIISDVKANDVINPRFWGEIIGMNF